MESNAQVGSDTILIPQNTYVLSNTGEDDSGFLGDLDITGELIIINGITGGFVIDGNGSDRIFHVHSGGDLTLINATLTHGVANSPNVIEGGAVKIENGG
ncbi:hypothetical protein [Marinicella litoralis]|uniref:hypothetical protein n=1 Tax=Marinicella litoralis TaxID=644220 RepID=UPI000BFF05CF|nr:hypothetical protein [Marinicella litoralis]